MHAFDELDGELPGALDGLSSDPLRLVLVHFLVAWPALVLRGLLSDSNLPRFEPGLAAVSMLPSRDLGRVTLSLATGKDDN